MVNKKQITLVVAAMLLLIMPVVLVSALDSEDYEAIWSQPPKAVADAPTFWEKLVMFFGQETFTIIGLDRDCDGYAKYYSQSINGVSQTSYFSGGKAMGYWSFSPGTVGGSSASLAENFCSSGHGLFDVYCQTNAFATPGQVGAFRFEQKDGLYFTCTSACAKCNVELYCCPYDCGEGDSCPSGETCSSKSVPTDIKLLDMNANQLSTYKYCKASDVCTGSPTTCWRLNSAGTSCESQTYTCDQSVYKSSCPIGSYVYSSKTACQADICVPVNTCAGDTCIGSFCTNNCGTSIPGTKNCGGGDCIWVGPCQSDNPNCLCTPKENGASCTGAYECKSYYCKNSICTAPTCTDEERNGLEEGIDCGGPCQACGSGACGDGVCQRGEQQYSSPSSLNPDYCKKDCPVDPPVKASIYDVVLSDSQGNYISSDDELQPGEMVTVKFKVRVKYEDFKLRLKESLPDLFVGGALPLVPWSYDSRMEYNIETGIIPASTAIDWFGKDANVQTFSINNLFAVSQRESECCEGQTNILADKTKYTQNWAGQTWRAIWDNQQEYVVSEHEIQIQVPSSTTKDLCPMEGGLPSKYWDPDSGVYILYIDIKNGCFAENGVFTGYTNPQDAYFSITLNVNGSEEYEGKKCEINADCGPNGFCLPCSQLPKGSCKWYEYLGKRCSSTSNETEINTTTASKFPLTKEEIKTSTSGDLLSAACYYDTDCAKRTNYTSDCIPVASLVEEGTMTASGKDDLFSSGKNLLTVGFAGAGIGTTLCMVGVGLSSVTLGASTLVGCGVSGALIAVSAVQGISKLPSGVDKDSVYSKELQKAINDGDSNKVGICTATPETKPFDIKGWLEKIGGYVKITGTPMIDGIIIVIIGFFLVSTILKGIGGKSEGGRR